MAATVLSDDPTFGRVCLGGDWTGQSDDMRITPEDGVRRRFHARLDTSAVSLPPERDHFSASDPITLAEDMTRLHSSVASYNTTPHTTRLHLAHLPKGRYASRNGERPIAQLDIVDGQPVTIDLPIDPVGGTPRFTITKSVP